MIFDTHAHYDDEKFDKDRDEIIKSLSSNNVKWVIDPGCDLKSSIMSVSLSEKYDFIYSAVGWHPEELSSCDKNWLNNIYDLAVNNKKVVAIGEIGLDYYWDKEHKEQQKKAFIEQLKLAEELDLPVIIHDREAHGDCLDIVSKFQNIRGVFHCFSGSVETAKILIDKGWYLGFDGPITYKNSKKQLEVLKICPLDRILIETDSPYLPPVPHRGERNNSTYLKYVIEKVAEIKCETCEKIEQLTAKNASDLFNIEL